MKKLRIDERKPSSRQYAAKSFMILNAYFKLHIIYRLRDMVYCKSFILGTLAHFRHFSSF
jgi:hypothetical protein